MVIYKVKCNLSRNLFKEFAKSNFGDARLISPCMRLDEGDFSSYRVMEEQKYKFLEFLDLNKVAYNISVI